VHCRSYLAAPLVGMEGGIGTLAVLSPKPNQFYGANMRRSWGGRAGAPGDDAAGVFGSFEGQDHSLRSRQRIERALTVERNFVSAVLDTMSAAGSGRDTADACAVHRAAKISGYTFAELAGRSFPQELVPDGKSGHRRSI